MEAIQGKVGKEKINRGALESEKEKDSLLHTKESTKPFYMPSFRAFFVHFLSLVKASGLKSDMTTGVMGLNPRNTIRRVFKLLS